MNVVKQILDDSYVETEEETLAELIEALGKSHTKAEVKDITTSLILNLSLIHI